MRARSTPRKHLIHRGLPVAAVAGATLLAPSAIASTKPADTVYRGGAIHTFDSQNRTVRALATHKGRVVYAGSERGVREFIGKKTVVHNLEGKAVLPGLQDAHLHVLAAGTQLLKCNLAYAPLTVSEFQAEIQSCLDADPSATRPLEVVNWYRQNMKPVGTDGSRQILDALKTTRPIIVSSTDGHSTVVNSKALELAGVTANTPDPPSGKIARGADGQPTGILEDSAQELAVKLIPADTEADTLKAMETALDSLRQAGVTSLGAQQPEVDELKAYRTLYKQGKLTARVNASLNVTETEARKSTRASVNRLLGLRKRFETGRLKVKPGIRVRGAGELFQDGVLQAPAQTASLLAPYFDAEGRLTTSSGPKPYFASSVMTDLVYRLLKADFSPQVHAIGDRAVRATLNDFEAVRRRLNRRPARLSIAHAELVDPADYGRFKKLDVTPVMSYQWGKPAPDSIDAAKVFMGPKRFSRMEPEGRLAGAGARVAFGSDWPVDPLNQFFAMEVGVTRRNEPGGGYKGRLNSDPGLTRLQAFEGITKHAAYQMKTERKTGSLQPGKYADLIVVNRDPFKVAERRISETKVLRTVVGGKTVFKAR